MLKELLQFIGDTVFATIFLVAVFLIIIGFFI